MKLTKENIMKVMNENNKYEFFGLRHDNRVYAIGEEAWGGNDYMEIIMAESVVIAEF